MLEQLRLFGAPPEVLRATQERLQAEAEQATEPVWPENWHAVSLFMAMQTQWHWLSSLAGARRVGLRYEALPAVLAHVRRSVPARWRLPQHDVMDQLQHLEHEVLLELERVDAAK